MIADTACSTEQSISIATQTKQIQWNNYITKLTNKINSTNRSKILKLQKKIPKKRTKTDVEGIIAELERTELMMNRVID